MRKHFPLHPLALLLAAIAIALVGVPAFAQSKSGPQPGEPGSAEAPAEKGVLAAAVQPESPAAKAGLVRGDIILEIGGTAVNNPDELLKALDSRKPGETVKIKVRHGDAEKIMSVTLADHDGRAQMGVMLFPPPRGPRGDMRRGDGPRGFGPGDDMPCETCPRGDMRRGDGPRGFGPGEDMPFAPVVTIVKVVAGSPAEKAGLKAGDAIISVDGKKIDPRFQLKEYIAAKKAGDTVTLGVQDPQKDRDQPPREITVTLAKSPGSDKGETYLGIEYTLGVPRGGAFDGRREERRAPESRGQGGTGGILVSDVVKNGPASKAGIKARDVIVAMDGERMHSPVEIAQKVAAHTIGDSVKITVYRFVDDKEMDFTVTLGENPSEKGKPWVGITASGVMRMMIPENGGSAGPSDASNGASAPDRTPPSI